MAFIRRVLSWSGLILFCLLGDGNCRQASAFSIVNLRHLSIICDNADHCHVRQRSACREWFDEGDGRLDRLADGLAGSRGLDGTQAACPIGSLRARRRGALPAWREALAQAGGIAARVPALGLQIRAGVQPRHLGVLGYLVAASDNLGEAMRVYLSYERLFLAPTSLR